MNKAELKEKWGKYIDTDQLVNQMMALYSKNNHRSREHGVCVGLDEFFTNKEHLIKAIMNSNHYIGNLRISLQKEFDRQCSSNDIWSCVNKFRSNFGSNYFYRYKDEDNKAFDDYFRTGKVALSFDDLTEESVNASRLEKIRQFNYSNKVTHASNNRYWEFSGYMDYFKNVTSTTLQQDWQYQEDRGPLLKKGTKTSRAFNKVCAHYGVDTHESYNKMFAYYSDLVSDLKRDMYFIISLNPLDYLTMSVGSSWQSCHNIKSGSYKGGCMSYMLDSTSIITYVVNALDDNIHETPKFYRQMFHYDDGLFVQNRLYPQGNDGATDLYAKFRGFVTEEFAEILDVEDEWDVQVGYNACTKHITSRGVHYQDYNYNRSCAIFYPRSKADKVLKHKMTIGHEGICACCGKQYTSSYSFAHDGRDRDCIIV